MKRYAVRIEIEIGLNTSSAAEAERITRNNFDYSLAGTLESRHAAADIDLVEWSCDEDDAYEEGK